ncbi:HD domain-containing phosphohydrolase [Butyrivibrio sp. YAB3001]|uniref:HD domain-containing phosphohydrolase n=1 Tax=Butyrivibrio sp. YAB3001 TaxID=1520812 RepID=UPI0008F64027|nr:HD domain-containing phosphohydrolase [Butyrivibrio sp. YAB3001]SFB83037.1 HD-GYP domain [Butyrivibrio sp. YAB3001]
MKAFSADHLIQIAIALSAEKNIDRLLDMILKEAITISTCDAGTVYVREGEQLFFHNTYTGASGFPDASSNMRKTMPPLKLTREYVSACAVLDKKKINIPDVYESVEYDFSGAKKYDAMNNYRTKSMLVIPLEDDKGEVLGALQLINAQNEKKEVVPFPAEVEDIIYALASLAAVSLTNRRLAAQVLDTLHSFVEVMVEAIDTRSSYNANHTKSMVGYARKFLEYIGQHHDNRTLTEEEADSFLMSVWLHDIGKLVIPLEVMDKATRLGEKKEVVKNRVTVACLMEEIRGLKNPEEKEKADEAIKNLRDAYKLIEECDTKGFLPDDLIEKLKQASQLKCLDENGCEQTLLSEDELIAITVRKGTLTDEERNIMQSHVVYTGRMLDKMNFEGIYANVPKWAAAHHELLDGSGYPQHVKADDIPLQVRFLTIIDVYDALTAEDRPYKPPMPPEKALGILDNMAEEGKIDKNILELFKESKAWDKKGS